MEANARTPRELFDGKVRYEIPPFQRPYVWTEEDQWQPLWDDIVRVADSLLEVRHDQKKVAELPGHFLGAVVLKQLRNDTGDPSRLSVIDGQQRLITLQMLIDAAQIVAEEFGEDDDAESLQELVLNEARRFRGSPKRFKLWPSRIDREAFEHVMDNELSDEHIVESRLSQAHRFFQDAMREWCDVTDDPDKIKSRLSALAQVLEQHLQMVAIDLSSKDDDQLIFETLNDRGTPLLAADLIKNYVFQRCEDVGADVDAWGETYWQDFDDDWWRDQVAQGRLFRSRIDLFLQYWLTMRIRDEVPTDAVFSHFRTYSADHLNDKATAEAFLKALRIDADTFRDFAQLDIKSARGSFYSRVVESLELGAFTPLLLWLISENHQAPADQSDMALAAVESWAVRRTFLRETMKDVNKLVVAILKKLDGQPINEVGDATRKFLLEQTAESRSWPTDADVRQKLPNVKVYGNIKQPRIRTFLSGIELRMRTARHEDVTLPAKLEIEHIMPQAWRTYWGADLAGDPDKAAKRDQLVNSIGNLTLVTQKLNGALSNRPWTDAETERVASTGKDAGKGKRSLLSRFSVLLLNKDVVDNHVDFWSEEDIVSRSKELTEAIISIWPHG
jgi:hypothetical protein